MITENNNETELGFDCSTWQHFVISSLVGFTCRAVVAMTNVLLTLPECQMLKSLGTQQDLPGSLAPVNGPFVLIRPSEAVLRVVTLSDTYLIIVEKGREGRDRDFFFLLQNEENARLGLFWFLDFFLLLQNVPSCSWDLRPAASNSPSGDVLGRLRLVASIWSSK